MPTKLVVQLARDAGGFFFTYSQQPIGEGSQLFPGLIEFRFRPLTLGYVNIGFKDPYGLADKITVDNLLAGDDEPLATPFTVCTSAPSQRPVRRKISSKYSADSGKVV
jgi:hypothetical protein